MTQLNQGSTVTQQVNKFTFTDDNSTTQIVYYPDSPGPLSSGSPRPELDYQGSEGSFTFNRQEALAMLYERYGSLVYGVALKLLKNSQEAEDLTEEIFLALWRHASSNREHGYFNRYLIAMTRSRAIDKIRAHGRNLNLLQRWGQTVTGKTSANSPFEQASLTERSQQVRSALAQLSQQQRQVLEMAYDEGLSQSEIALRLDIPLGTVKNWTRQGLLRLSSTLSIKPRGKAASSIEADLNVTEIS